MGKVARADWAASVPYEGIIGLPSVFPSGPVDMSDITGDGYAQGQVPAFNASTGRFVPHTIPSPVPTPPTPGEPIVEVFIYWDTPTLRPLQTCTEDFDLVGVIPPQMAIVGTEDDLQFCTAFAWVPEANKVRVMVTNNDLNDITLGSGVWKVRVFN